MSISKDELVKRKEQIKKDFDSLVEQIKTEEDKIKSMKNNLNALMVRVNNVICLSNRLKTKGTDAIEKAQALEIATS